MCILLDEQVDGHVSRIIYYVGVTSTTSKRSRTCWLTKAVVTETEVLDLMGPPGSLEIFRGERTLEDE